MSCCIASAWVAFVSIAKILLHESAWVALLLLLTAYKGSTHHLLLDRSAVSQGTVALHHASA